MISPEHEPLLPRVEEGDLLLLVGQDVLDPTQKELWERFGSVNPILARELLKRAYFKAAEVDRQPPLSLFELQKIMLDLASFAFGALEVAARRMQDEPRRPTVGDGVEYQQPSV